MMSWIVILQLFAVVSMQTHPANVTPRVEVADFGDAPYSVVVLTPSVCSGALVNSRWVLTAAHCVYHIVTSSKKKQNITILAGSQNTSRSLQKEGKVQRRVSDLVVVHPSFTGNWAEHDIALVRLQQRLKLSSAVKTIELSGRPWGNTTRMCHVPGFGVLSKGKKNTLDYRFKVHTINITKPCPCEKLLSYENGERRVEGWLCSDLVPHSGPCKGEFGAPLVCDGRLCGITSASFYVYEAYTCHMTRDLRRLYCGTSHDLNIFINIHPYIGWVNKTMASRSATAPVPRHLLLFITFSVLNSFKAKIYKGITDFGGKILF